MGGILATRILVEQDLEGNCIVSLPEIPETNKGHLLLARQNQVRIVESMTASQLDAPLKKIGKGLLTDYGIRLPDKSSYRTTGDS
jgi:hypothetical protein